MRSVLRMILLLAIISFAASSEELLDVYFIDVGHGDAVLIKYGTDEWLIDTGYKNAWPRTSVCSDLLGVDIDLPVEYFILSHPDLDHYSALDLLACPCQIRDFFSSPDPEAQVVLEADVNIAIDCSSSLQTPLRVDELSTGVSLPFKQSELEWNVLYPDPGFALGPASTNDKSIVILLTLGDVSFLFSGDIVALPASAESWDVPSATLIVKAPHHGRENSATVELARSLAPDLVVASSKHSVPETAPAVTSLGVPMISTKASGTIHIQTDGITWWMETDVAPGLVLCGQVGS